MTDRENNVVNLTSVKAKSVGVCPDLAEVISQINQRFNVHIDIQDARLDRFKTLFPALNEAAKQQHRFDIEAATAKVEKVFMQGVEIGKAQMMTDVIVCILEQDGLIERRNDSDNSPE